MRRIIVGSLVLLMAGVAVNKSHAQVDPHFTQYYVNTAWLNPAMTGVFDGSYRASAIYRNQWGNVSTPYSTVGASIEGNTNKDLNLGVNIINQTAGDGGYKYTTAYANFAYTGVRFGANGYHHLVTALQVGIIQRKFNPSKLIFGDQWNPVTGQTKPTAESFANPTASSFDAGAGLLYFDGTPGKKANVFAGFSASHLTRPDNKFSATGNERIPIRYTIHAGVKIAVSDMVSLTPHAMYLKQGTAEEKMLGLYAQLRAAETTDLLLGVNYRYKDAMSAHAGFSFKNMVLGLSYDVNTSDLGKAISGTNSFELSLSFTGIRKTKTPEVEFVCPRL